MSKQIAIPIADPTVREAQGLISKLIKNAGGRALFVGGCVRDALLGLTPKDFDIEVYGVTPKQLIELLSHQFSLDLVGESFGVIKLKGIPIDLSLPRRESKRGLGHKGFEINSDPSMTVDEAAGRRDFTINAMSWDPESQELVDPFGGLEDLESKTLRHCTESFKEDPLRVLRGMQFAGRYSLKGATETITMSQGLLPEYSTLSIERVWAEWYKWSSQSVKPSAGLNFLRQTEWVEMYPELKAMIGCLQDPEFHPEGDVWTHTLLVADEAATIAERDELGRDERAILVLAALCHDVGKPATTEKIDGRIRSRGHCETLETFQVFLARLGTPSEMVDRVVTLCRYHLSHVDFQESPRHVRRLSVALANEGETLEMLGRLVEADHSGRPPLPKELPEKMKAMLDMAQNLNVQNKGPKPLLLGRHLLELGLTPGPMMGEMLRSAFETQLNGEIESLEEAKQWVKKNYLNEI